MEATLTSEDDFGRGREGGGRAKREIGNRVQCEGALARGTKQSDVGVD